MNPLKLIPFPWNLVASLVLAAVVIGSAAYAWHRFTDAYREEGRVEVRAELVPQLEHQTKLARDAAAANKQLQADLANLQQLLATQNAQLDTMRARALAAEIAARKALLAAAEAAKRYDAEVARLTALAGAPVITEDDCAQAKTILARLAADSLRDAAPR